MIATSHQNGGTGPTIWRDIAPRAMVATVVAVLLFLGTASLAAAHPVIVRSDPPDAAVLGASPTSVRLWYSEEISRGFSTARVLDVRGNTITGVKVSTALANQRILDVILPADLAPGVYVIDWKVLSSVDGHATQGHLTFGVGLGSNPASPPAKAADPPTSGIEDLLRSLYLITLTGSLGALAAYALVLRLVPKKDREDQAVRAPLVAVVRRIRVWAIIGCWAALIAGFALIAWQVVSVGAPEQSFALGLAGARQLVTETRWGQLWLARQCAFALIAAGMSVRASTGGWIAIRRGLRLDPVRPVIIATAAAVVVATETLSSHAATLPTDPIVTVAASSLHLVAASVWIGGLVALGLGLWPMLRAGGPATAAAVVVLRDFGKVAGLCVGVLGATGLFVAGREVATPDALITTTFGKTLLVKVGVAFTVALIGVLCSVVLGARIPVPVERLFRRSPESKPMLSGWLPRLIVVEASLGLIVLGLTGVLTSQPLALGSQFDPRPPPPPTTLSQTVGDMLVVVEVKPNIPGENVVSLRVVSTRRPRPAPVYDVEARFIALGFDGRTLSQTQVRADKVEPDFYRVGGSYLSRPGPWRIEVVARRLGLKDTVATFDWTVGTGIPPKPPILSDQPLESALSWTAAVILFLMAVVAAQRLILSGRWRRAGPARRSVRTRGRQRAYATKQSS